jgi:superfamily II DNA or RNA helicase
MTRKDGLTKVFKYFIGPVVHKEKTDLTAEVLVKSIDYNCEDMFEGVKTDFRGQPLYSCMITRLGCADRNNMIARVIQHELELNPDQQIMVLSHTKTMILDLYKLIGTFEHSIGYYLGGMKEEHLKESESKKIILGTYAMASEGLDIKTLTTLVLATPKSDVCQSVGRILRSKHSSPLVIDIVDPHQVFDNQYKKRVAYYMSKNYIVQHYTSYRNYESNTYVQKQKKGSTKSADKEKRECLVKMSPSPVKT